MKYATIATSVYGNKLELEMNLVLDTQLQSWTRSSFFFFFMCDRRNDRCPGWRERYSRANPEKRFFL